MVLPSGASLVPRVSGGHAPVSRLTAGLSHCFRVASRRNPSLLLRWSFLSPFQLLQNPEQGVGQCEAGKGQGAYAGKDGAVTHAATCHVPVWPSSRSQRLAAVTL